METIKSKLKKKEDKFRTNLIRKYRLVKTRRLFSWSRLSVYSQLAIIISQKQITEITIECLTL